MILKKILFFVFIMVYAFAFCQSNKAISTSNHQLKDSVFNPTTVKPIPHLEIPKTKPNDSIIYHVGYALLYNEQHEQATWVAYELTKEETTKLFDRTNKFIVDPKVKTGTATNKDYEGYGFDRGHLAPAADMSWSDIAMKESFYFSNMSPQVPNFNRGIWKKLEEQVRQWAIENNSLHVITGPVLSDNLQIIGINKVSVPNYYYKAILDYSEPDIKGIGFIMPNTKLKDSIQHYAVSIDSLESFTGIDFFHLLPNNQEVMIEKTVCIPCWQWKKQKNISKKMIIEDSLKTENQIIHPIKDSIATEKTTTVQCSGKTKSGKRCQRMTSNLNGKCYQH